MEERAPPPGIFPNITISEGDHILRLQRKVEELAPLEVTESHKGSAPPAVIMNPQFALGT